jgi:hypothetical protein
LQTNPDKRFTYNQVKEVLQAKDETDLKKIEQKYFNENLIPQNQYQQIIKYNNKEY